MQRRSLLRLGAFLPACLLPSRYLKARTPKVPSYAEQLKQAEQLNQLAATIHTPEDARRFVDFVADMFADVTPSALRSHSLRGRISQAEFAAVSNPGKLIPEVRLAEAWNTYMDDIQAPLTSRVSVPELRYLRDSYWTSARLFWDRDHHNFWSVPSIYATQADGALASGSRAIESIRVLSDLSLRHDNLRIAREGVAKGIVPSDIFKERQLSTSSGGGSFISSTSYSNPVTLAEWQYKQAHGMRAYRRLIVEMLDTVLA